MDARELAAVKRRITTPLDVDEVIAGDDAESLAAAIAADTFNAEACDARRLLTTAEYDLLTVGSVRDDLARTLRERAEQRDARRLELLSKHAPFLI
jgi:hypothetical protein